MDTENVFHLHNGEVTESQKKSLDMHSLIVDISPET
uniref:Uncharacterized protein n=1 Tax=Trichinella nativa TaxID=6335 RepID=A0A0V1KH10_9BILA